MPNSTVQHNLNPLPQHPARERERGLPQNRSTGVPPVHCLGETPKPLWCKNGRDAQATL